MCFRREARKREYNNVNLNNEHERDRRDDEDAFVTNATCAY